MLTSAYALQPPPLFPTPGHFTPTGFFDSRSLEMVSKGPDGVIVAVDNIGGLLNVIFYDLSMNPIASYGRANTTANGICHLGNYVYLSGITSTGSGVLICLDRTQTGTLTAVATQTYNTLLNCCEFGGYIWAVAPYIDELAKFNPVNLVILPAITGVPYEGTVEQHMAKDDNYIFVAGYNLVTGVVRINPATGDKTVIATGTGTFCNGLARSGGRLFKSADIIRAIDPGDGSTYDSVSYAADSLSASPNYLFCHGAGGDGRVFASGGLGSVDTITVAGPAALVRVLAIDDNHMMIVTFNGGVDRSEIWQG